MVGSIWTGPHISAIDEQFADRHGCWQGDTRADHSRRARRVLRWSNFAPCSSVFLIGAVLNFGRG